MSDYLTCQLAGGQVGRGRELVDDFLVALLAATSDFKSILQVSTKSFPFGGVLVAHRVEQPVELERETLLSGRDRHRSQPTKQVWCSYKSASNRYCEYCEYEYEYRNRLGKR